MFSIFFTLPWIWLQTRIETGKWPNTDTGSSMVEALIALISGLIQVGLGITVASILVYMFTH